MAQCEATNRAGGRCGRGAIPGGTVCSKHGGKAPQVAAKAAERVREATAAKALARWGIEPVDMPPSAALLSLVNSKVGEVAYWNNALTGVPEGDLPNAVELRLLHRTQDQLAAFAVGAIRANVELRADARAETDLNDQVNLVQDVLMNALQKLVLTEEQWRLVPGALVAALETCEQVGESVDRYRPPRVGPLA